MDQVEAAKKEKQKLLNSIPESYKIEDGVIVTTYPKKITDLIEQLEEMIKYFEKMAVRDEVENAIIEAFKIAERQAENSFCRVTSPDFPGLMIKVVFNPITMSHDRKIFSYKEGDKW